MRRTLRIVGHGDGPIAKKAVDLSLRARHANKEIVSVENKPSFYGRYLKSLGVIHKPKNLLIKQRMSSVDYLRSLPKNHLDHQWAHFSASAMPFEVRQAFFKEVFRTLAPGKKFVVVDSGMARREYCKELGALGFRVSARPLSIQEARKLATPDTDLFINQNREFEKMKAHFGGRVPERVWAEMRENWILNMITGVETGASQAAVNSLERISKSIKDSFSVTPFVRIIATKPK